MVCLIIDSFYDFYIWFLIRIWIISLFIHYWFMLLPSWGTCESGMFENFAAILDLRNLVSFPSVFGIREVGVNDVDEMAISASAVDKGGTAALC